MNGVTTGEKCLEKLLGCLPEDINFPEKAADSNDKYLDCSTLDKYYNSLTSSLNQISCSVASNLETDMRYCELGDFKLPSQNMEELPPDCPSPDVTAMEIDHANSDVPTNELEPESIKNGLVIDAEPSTTAETVDVSMEVELKPSKVPCLQTVESLQKICEEKGWEFNVCDSTTESDDDSDQDYAVDFIYDHKVVDDDIHYLIKWKNYPKSSSTWEPSWHLNGCSEMVEFYHAVRGSKRVVTNNTLRYFVRDLLVRKPSDTLTLTKLCAACFGESEKHVKSLKLTPTLLKMKAKEVLSFSTKKLRSIEERLFRVMQYGEARRKLLVSLKEWEDTINLQSLGAPVVVENNVDLEYPPTDFKFIDDYINATSIPLPLEPVTFCNCEGGCYKSKDFCCPSESDGLFPYNKHRRLVLQPGYPIFECNDRCSCDDSCPNRVVQHGQKIKVAIFRTRGKGWGLKTLEPIEKGQFVLEYLGEIITFDTAEARGRIYDYVGRSYLFDLDYNVETEKSCYTVDAGHVGNVSHFINHSCDPNLHVYAVWINQQDPRLPRLAFFAKKKIFKGEELTFDYKMSKDRRNDSSEDSSDESDRIPCKCLAKNCRKYLF